MDSSLRENRQQRFTSNLSSSLLKKQTSEYRSKGMTSRRNSHRRAHRLKLVTASLRLSLSLVQRGCLDNESSEGYYGKIVVPHGQEFRWSDGGVPQTFDPAFAAAPPDTDAVRAIFEGLTDYDPRTLEPIPAVATSWESSDDGRVWTFYLRNDARWSNGEFVTAKDFVRSWLRTIKIGQLSPHTELLTNIVGARANLFSESHERPRTSRTQTPPVAEPAFGAEALDDHVLRVHLKHADSNFPALVAHSVFRPVKLEN